MTVLDRFLRYISVDTTSNPESTTCPSTPNQLVLGKMVLDEMLAMGITDARQDEHGYVYGSIPATCEGEPSIGLIAHLDTSNAVPGGPMNARVVRCTGEDILLNEEKQIVLSAADFPFLHDLAGEDLVVTDGLTLLGGDDKAGMAAILTLCEKLLAEPSIPHGKICIGFTPDEEIGRGTDFFDVEGFGADFAYTVDGGALNSLSYENFNAASARVAVKGRSIHPGGAKGRMKNAARIAMEFHSMLPPLEIPENTCGYEGFSHLTHMEGQEESALLCYIIRDHDMAKFQAKKSRFEKIAAYLNELYGEGTITLALEDSYFNMKEYILPHPEIIQRAEDALKKLFGQCICDPIRGGTDGAHLSEKGLPCPNLPTGAFNGHGVFECVPVSSMEKVVELLEEIVRAH